MSLVEFFLSPPKHSQNEKLDFTRFQVIDFAINFLNYSVDLSEAQRPFSLTVPDGQVDPGAPFLYTLNVNTLPAGP